MDLNENEAQGRRVWSGIQIHSCYYLKAAPTSVAHELFNLPSGAERKDSLSVFPSLSPDVGCHD